jgi:hypothetical protein
LELQFRYLDPSKSLLFRLLNPPQNNPKKLLQRGNNVVLCSVDDVRTRIQTSLTSLEITYIISDVSREVLTLAKSTDESNALIILAGKNAAWAATIRRMKTTGEMAASVKTANSQRQNTSDQDIEYYESEKRRLIQEYKDTVRYSNFLIPSGRMGYKTVNGES